MRKIKDIFINMWIAASLVLLIAAMIACHTMGDKFPNGHYVHGDYSLAACFLIGSFVCVGIWAIVTITPWNEDVSNSKVDKNPISPTAARTSGMIMDKDLNVVYNDFTKLSQIEDTTTENVAVVVWVGHCKKWTPMVYDTTGVVGIDELVGRMIRDVLFGTNFRLKIIKKVDNVYFCDCVEK